MNGNLKWILFPLPFFAPTKYNNVLRTSLDLFAVFSRVQQPLNSIASVNGGLEEERQRHLAPWPETTSLQRGRYEFVTEKNYHLEADSGLKDF